MPKSGLPNAKVTIKSLKIGSISIKTEKPTESKSDVEKSINNLKKAVNKNIFAENANSFI